MADNIQDFGIGSNAGFSSSSAGFSGGSVGQESTSDSGALKQKATKLGAIAKERIYKQADAQLDSLTEQIRGVRGRLELIADEAGPEKKLIDGALGAIDTVTAKLEGRSAEELVREAGRQMKEHPVAFVAGMCVLGFIGGRLVKS